MAHRMTTTTIEHLRHEAIPPAVHTENALRVGHRHTETHTTTTDTPEDRLRGITARLHHGGTMIPTPLEDRHHLREDMMIHMPDRIPMLGRVVLRHLVAMVDTAAVVAVAATEADTRSVLTR